VGLRNDQAGSERRNSFWPFFFFSNRTLDVRFGWYKSSAKLQKPCNVQRCPIRKGEHLNDTSTIEIIRGTIHGTRKIKKTSKQHHKPDLLAIRRRIHRGRISLNTTYRDTDFSEFSPSICSAHFGILQPEIL
jgi:hypothetical protein